jgi:hypothetical protein
MIMCVLVILTLSQQFFFFFYPGNHVACEFSGSAAGTQFTCFTGTTAQILTLRKLKDAKAKLWDADTSRSLLLEEVVKASYTSSLA